MELNRAHEDRESIVAMTNEERFIASCQSVGEADVRQRLSANRYGGRRALWASSWLEQVESGKSDATKAEERSSRSPATGRNRHFASGFFALVFVLLLASVVLLLKFA
jgi:hypothetical protein